MPSIGTKSPKSWVTLTLGTNETEQEKERKEQCNLKNADWRMQFSKLFYIIFRQVNYFGDR